MPLPIPQTEEEWLSCLELPRFSVIIPAGHNINIARYEGWIDGNGKHMSRAEYIELHGVDPVVVWTAKKEYIKRYGGGVHIEK